MTEYLPFLIGAAAFIGFAVFKKKKAERPTKTITPWRINHSSGVPDLPTTHGSGWYIDIPQAPGHLNYVQWYEEPRMAIGGSIRIRYRVEGGPFYQSENGLEATAGLMVQRKGDNMTARGKYAGYRWFCRRHLPLTAGDHDYTITLTEAEWSQTVNDPDAASFADCLANADNLSIVFGGSGGRGHGVYGSGRFELVSLT